MSDDNPTLLFWGGPANSRKFHIFYSQRSLCGKWWYVPDLDLPVTLEQLTRLPSSLDDCRECVRRAAAQLTPLKSARKDGES